MLSSVTDLLRYINENQLTSEFGGTLDYCHSDWIVLRTVSYKSILKPDWDQNKLHSSSPFYLLLLSGVHSYERAKSLDQFDAGALNIK